MVKRNYLILDHRASSALIKFHFCMNILFIYVQVFNMKGQELVKDMSMSSGTLYNSLQSPYLDGWKMTENEPIARINGVMVAVGMPPGAIGTIAVFL